MAESIICNPHVFEVEGDFFLKFRLKEEEILVSGKCGDVVLAIPVEKPEARRVVKKFTLLDEEHQISNEETFYAEAKFMQSFEHPYLAKCILAARCQDYLAICMCYYPRGTLDEYLGGLNLDLTEKCISQVACALRYLHKHNVAHLDVKLDNIFLDANFNAILGDFGLTVELQPQQKTLAKADCGGTPCYYAPEMIGAADDKQLDPYKLDAYCLGIVWWAIVTQRQPDQNINYYHETRKKRDLPTKIRELLLKLLKKNPTERISVTAFLRRLRRDSVHRNIIDSS